MGLVAFTRVKSTLAKLVLATTNYILCLSQEEGVGKATAYLSNIVLNDVKSFDFNWNRSVLYSRWLANLPTEIVAPTVYFIEAIIQKPSC